MVSIPPGSSLGRYRIIEQLGRGGMATVFRCHDPVLDRYVAAKVLPSYHTEDPTFVQRFSNEAQTVARLSHPNILQIYDFGEDKGYTYIVSELVLGGDLQDKLGDEPMPLEDVLKLMRPLAEALDYAHGQGIIHRDLKPANILLDADSRPILADFGLARMLESSTRFTQTAQTMGTPEYMAPEQAMGADADHRSDLYAFGIMVYQMLLGQTPFRADTPAATLMAHVHRPLPLPSVLNPDIEPRLEATLLKALAKDPNDRFQSAGDMIQALLIASGQAPSPSADEYAPTAVIDASQLGNAADAMEAATEVIEAGRVAVPAEALAALEGITSRVEENVIKLRDITPEHDVDTQLRTREQLAAITKGFFRREALRQQVFEAQELYKALGLMDEDDDLEEILLGIQLQQVYALFDDESEVVYVLSDATSIGPAEELGYVSAFMGGIQQQRFDISELRARAREGGSDQFRALSALVGGNVAQVAQGYVTTVFSREQVDELREPLPDNKLLKAPRVIRETVLFPQREGADFLAEIFGVGGGWDGVNEVYTRPPESSEQVLHPANNSPRRHPRGLSCQTCQLGWGRAGCRSARTQWASS